MGTFFQEWGKKNKGCYKMGCLLFAFKILKWFELSTEGKQKLAFQGLRSANLWNSFIRQMSYLGFWTGTALIKVTVIFFAFCSLVTILRPNFLPCFLNLQISCVLICLLVLFPNIHIGYVSKSSPFSCYNAFIKMWLFICVVTQAVCLLCFLSCTS